MLTEGYACQKVHLVEAIRKLKAAATHFPIVVEREDAGVFSAYVAGLPVYAQGATAMEAERAIQRTLTACLEPHPGTSSSAIVKVATVDHQSSAGSPRWRW